jgi:putative tryptophan/tyrosine transport system substrate-binding protein
MKNKIAHFAIVLAMMTFVSPAAAQQASKVYRIGFLSAGTPPESSNIQAFRQTMQGAGYVEGKNIAFEFRWAEGKPDQVQMLAAELLALPVDVIVAYGTATTHVAKNATQTIPIVMQAGNPVAAGLIDSLAQPGGNITGLTSISGQLGGKYLELLKETAPRVTRVAIPLPESDNTKLFLTESAAPAKALNLQLLPLLIRKPEDLENLLQTAVKERANGLLSRIPAGFRAQRKRLIEFAATYRLPAIYESRGAAEDGGLIGYGTDRDYIWRRFAVYVDKILKGAKPADLPVEQPTKFELVINLNTAKQIGLTIPPHVLARADRVIR